MCSVLAVKEILIFKRSKGSFQLSGFNHNNYIKPKMWMTLMKSARLGLLHRGAKGRPPPLTDQNLTARLHHIAPCAIQRIDTCKGLGLCTRSKTNHKSCRYLRLTSATNMFIQVEDTPNPNSLKFYPGQTVLESGTANFPDKVQASLKSPLAKALFRINGVKSVFFAQDFLTVSKEDDEKVEWNVLKPQIFSAIMIFYTMKQPILYSSLDSDPNQVNEHDSEIIKEIKQLITDKIRPTIQEDGGDLEFVSFEDNIVRVRLQGACTSCPSSVVTLKNGIRNMLQYYIPEVQDVEQVVDED